MGNFRGIAVFSESSSWGGISTYCIELVKSLQNRHLPAWIFFPVDNRVGNTYVQDKCDLFHLHHKAISFNNPYDLRAITQISRILIEQNIDIVHTNGYRFNLILKICRLILLFKGKKIKHVVTVHGIPKKSNRLKYYHFLDKLTFKLQSTTICVSNFVKSSCYKNKSNKNNKIKVIHHGIEYRKEVKNTSGDSKLKCMFAGRLEEEKGITFLKDIIQDYLEKYPDDNIHFNIYGDGAQKNIINQLCMSYNKNVSYHGYLPDIHDAYKNNDILLITSKIETFGLVILEAAMNNIPTIATDVGGIPEIIKDMKNGALVSYGDVEAFTMKINKFYHDNFWMNKEFQSNIDQLNIDFSLNKMVDQIIAIYTELTN